MKKQSRNEDQLARFADHYSTQVDSRVTDGFWSSDERDTTVSLFSILAEQILQIGDRLTTADLRLIRHLALRGVFVCIATALAELAIQQRNARSISQAVVALMLDNCEYDPRESFISMVIIEHAVSRLGMRIDILLSDLKHMFPRRFVGFVNRYLTFDPLLRTLTSVGYSESSSEAGFRFRNRSDIS